MNIKNAGFRAAYQHFIVFPLKKNIKPCIKNYPNAENANCILTYGYIDHEAGLTMEILAAGVKNGDQFTFFDSCPEAKSCIRIGAVIEDEIFLLEDKDGKLRETYSEKLDGLKFYAVSEEIEKTREMTFLDKLRHDEYPDDVMVYLTKEGLHPEGCWVRIIGLDEQFIMGELLNEPDQDFGYHNGEKIAFFVHQQEDGNILLYTDMTPSQKLTAEDLEDGTLLKEAIIVFNQERTENHFLDILEYLRDSFVWIPCSAEKETLNRVPVISQNDKLFFPVFSGVEEMSIYNERFSKVKKHMLDVISLVKNNEKNFTGIVINAFTEALILDAELFDVIEQMKSRLI